MRNLDVVMHMNTVCVIVLGPIGLIRFHAPFAIWIAYCFVDKCWMNRYSVFCSICNVFCNCKLFDVLYSNKVIWTWFQLVCCIDFQVSNTKYWFGFGTIPPINNKKWSSVMIYKYTMHVKLSQRKTFSIFKTMSLSILLYHLFVVTGLYEQTIRFEMHLLRSVQFQHPLVNKLSTQEPGSSDGTCKTEKSLPVRPVNIFSYCLQISLSKSHEPHILWINF